MKRIVRALAFTACIVVGVLYLARTERVRAWLESPAQAPETWSQPGVHEVARPERAGSSAGVPVAYPVGGTN